MVERLTEIEFVDDKILIIFENLRKQLPININRLKKIRNTVRYVKDYAHSIQEHLVR